MPKMTTVGLEPTRNYPLVYVFPEHLLQVLPETSAITTRPSCHESLKSVQIDVCEFRQRNLPKFRI